MKILLINPPNYHIAKSSSGWDMEIDNIGLYPPIGLMYIAAYMRKNTDYEIRILDTLVDRLSYDEIGEHARKYNPNLVGVTSFTLTFYDVMETIKSVRKACPGAHINVGGPHTFLWWEDTIKKPEVDSVLLGEGEVSFTQLAETLERKGELKGVKGIVLKDGDKIIKTGNGELIRNLDELPFPAFDLVPYKRYNSINSREKSLAVIFSSRGCPFQCTYCDKTNFLYRGRSVENILDEMQQYYSAGIREFLFFDDLFNINPKKVIDVSEGIMRRGFKIRWTFRARVDQVTDEMVKAAKKSGCTLISFGVEDCTDEGLRMIKKGITTEQVLEAVETAKKHGLETSTNWIIGLPRHKSEKDVMELLDFAKKVDSTYAEFTILVPYYGTQIYWEGITKGVIKAGIWEGFVRSPQPDFLLPMWEEHLSREKLSELYHKCYKGYYWRSKYVLKSLLNTKNLNELCKKAIAAMKILGVASKKK
ncbi:MAG: radical SAM protein [Candidatus Altiarchaeota archaeon]